MGRTGLPHRLPRRAAVHLAADGRQAAVRVERARPRRRRRQEGARAVEDGASCRLARRAPRKVDAGRHRPRRADAGAAAAVRALVVRLRRAAAADAPLCGAAARRMVERAARCPRLHRRHRRRRPPRAHRRPLQRRQPRPRGDGGGDRRRVLVHAARRAARPPPLGVGGRARAGPAAVGARDVAAVRVAAPARGGVRWDASRTQRG